MKTRIEIHDDAACGGVRAVCVSQSRNVRGELYGKIDLEVQGYGIGTIGLTVGQAREVAEALMAFVRTAEAK